MNKRIKELALQANPKNIFKEFDRDDIAFVEKFAELIVNEFQTILRDNRGADTGTLSYRVEEHFRS